MIDFEQAKAKARSMRKAADGLIEKISYSAAEINDNLGVLREWKMGVYDIGDVRMDEGNPYKCVQYHDSTHNPDWHPSNVPALWMQYHGTTRDTARPFIHPTGAQDMYLAGEYMIWTDGSIKRAKMDTAYSPDEYAQAWETV